jgi:diguanylate cyclase (GGDEF)-like protein
MEYLVHRFYSLNEVSSIGGAHQMWGNLIAKKPWTGELWNKNKDGDLRLEQVSISPVTDSDGEIINFIAVKQDITDKRKMEDKIWRQANFDDLTGLCNRKYFFERTQISLTRARRQHKQLLFLYIDLDKFKPINDTFGHAAGDQVLREFSQRLNRHVRRSDVAARLGGDEFALVIEDFPTDADVEGFIKTIRTTLFGQPIELELTHRSPAHHPQIDATIGWAVYPADGDELEALLEVADRRMYAAKLH